MYKVVFFGTPEFSVPCLKVLNDHKDFEICSVITMPDRPAGRGKKLQSPPVATFAKENNLPLIQTENINKDEEALSMLEALNPDFYLVIAFAQFLGKKALELPKYGAFNIHTSLLPKYRGAAPIQYALLNGDKSTGVSIQKMVSKMDAGDLCYGHTVEISPDDTSGSLFKKLENEAAVGLENFLTHFRNTHGELTYTAQNEENATFAPTIKKQDGLINPFNENFERLNNKRRAYSPWPGLYIFISGMRLKVHDIEVYPQKLKAGEVNISQGTLVIGLSDESAVRLKKIQAEGKKPQTDGEFLNGIKNKLTQLELDREHYE
ncbi:MAG: methionyl-tRNA formyltransferase [Halobacteriovoraceae bacterium]|nr:methionyl-tRNA formyltransferase [Halobacteriovoraceae bacterium]